jgi:hypothetical protein
MRRIKKPVISSITPQPMCDFTHAAIFLAIALYFPGVKQPGCDAGHPSHLAPRLKKEYNYTFASPSMSSRPVVG